MGNPELFLGVRQTVHNNSSMISLTLTKYMCGYGTNSNTVHVTVPMKKCLTINNQTYTYIFTIECTMFQNGVHINDVIHRLFNLKGDYVSIYDICYSADQTQFNNQIDHSVYYPQSVRESAFDVTLKVISSRWKILKYNDENVIKKMLTDNISSHIQTSRKRFSFSTEYQTVFDQNRFPSTSDSKNKIKDAESRSRRSLHSLI